MSEFNNNPQNESDIFSEPKQKITAKVKHSNDFKRQMTALIIAVCVVAVGSVAVLLFKYLPELNLSDKSAVVETTEEEDALPTLIDGEVLGPQNRIFIMEYIKNDNISEINIHNEYGDFGIIYNEEDDEYYIKDEPNATYNQESMQYLMSAAGYTLAIERIATENIEYSEYGLDMESSPAWYTISDRKGNTHKLFIGDRIPSNAGYYVKYDGRDAVYVLDSSISDYLLAPVEAIISPLLAFPMGQSTYYLANNIILTKDDEVFIAMEYIPDEERIASGSPYLHRMLKPFGYTPNDSNYLDVLALFGEYTGISTLKYKPSEEDLEKYGLTNPKYCFYFEYKKFPSEIWFSEKNENGNFYAYTPVFNLITEVEYDNADWLEWNLLEWLQRPIFQENIRYVKNITVESEKESYNFELTYGTDSLVKAVETNSKTTIADLDNFKQFYMSLLMTSYLDYAELDEAEVEELVENGAYLTLTFNMTTGKTLEYKFYPYESRKSYYTLNGEGHFYIVRDRMIKIIDDAARVLAGERVFPDANN